MPTDWELVNRVRCGDEEAFHQLVDRHAGALYGLAFHLVGNAADAEDVVQETLAGAFRGIGSVRDGASFKAWLTQIAVRQAARHHRNERKHRIARLDDGEADAPPAADRQLSSDLPMDLSGAMMSLEREFREVIVLRELQGLTYDEIAEALRVPRGTVESRLFRARRELQNLLKDYLA